MAELNEFVPWITFSQGAMALLFCLYNIVAERMQLAKSDVSEQQV